MSIAHYPQHWDSILSVQGEKMWLGRFYTEEEAIQAEKAGLEKYADKLNYRTIRNNRIVQRRKEGLTYKELGQEFGLTWQRCYQIVKENA